MGGSKETFTRLREQGNDIDCSGILFQEPKSNIDKAIIAYEKMTINCKNIFI